MFAHLIRFCLCYRIDMTLTLMLLGKLELTLIICLIMCLIMFWFLKPNVALNTTEYCQYETGAVNKIFVCVCVCFVVWGFFPLPHFFFTLSNTFLAH